MQIDLSKNCRSNFFRDNIILNVIKWCFQAHFLYTIQAQDCQLLEEMVHLLAREMCTSSSNHQHDSVNIISVCNGISRN